MSFSTQMLPLPGFATPELQSADAFRHILDAMARPGQIRIVGGLAEAPAPLHLASAIALLTLADMDTPVWLDEPLRTDAVLAFIRFHCGAPIVDDRARAAFAVLASAERVGSLDAFNLGDAEFPDRSTTLIIQVDALSNAGPRHLSGPGIQDRQAFGFAPDCDALWTGIAANRTRFPLGVDMIFTAGAALSGLPRSTAFTIEEIA